MNEQKPQKEINDEQKPQETNKEKEAVLKQAMKELNKKYGKNSIRKIDESDFEGIESISTGCYSLDKIFGCGGMPRGRIIECFGMPSAGKSVLAYYLGAQIQKQGGKVLLVDAECSFNREFASNIGLNVNDLLVSQVTTAEEALDIVDKMVNTHVIDLIIIDSVASLVPQKELEGELSKENMALTARLMSKFLRIITGNASKTKTIILFVNQLREKIGIFYGNPNVTPGGTALKFYSSVRLEVKKGKNIVDEKSRIIGNYITITGVKNKVGYPFVSAELSLYYGSGIDTTEDIINVGIAKEIIERSGTTYYFEDKKLAVGKKDLINVVFADKKLFKEIWDKLNENEKSKSLPEVSGKK